MARHRLPIPLRFSLVAFGAFALGLGVPTLWLWIGSLFQGSSGQFTRLDPTSAIVVVSGVVITYLALMIVAGWVMSATRSGAREPAAWNRSMRDAPRPVEKLSPLEATFVWAAVIANGSYFVWLIFFAEYTLPGS